MKGYLQRKFIKWLVHGLFNSIDENDFLVLTPKGGIMYKGVQLEKEQVLKIKADAKDFNKSTLWQALSSEIKYHANQRMYEKSQSIDDLLAGKIMLYIIEVIQKKLDSLTK